MLTATRSTRIRSLSASRKNARTRRLLMESLEERRVLANFGGIGNFLSSQLLALQTTALVSNDSLGGSLPVVGATLQTLAQSGQLLSVATTQASSLNDNTTDAAVLETNLKEVFGPTVSRSGDSFRIQFTNTSPITTSGFTSNLAILPIQGPSFTAMLTYTLDVTVGVDASGFYFNAGSSTKELDLSLNVADNALPTLQVSLGNLTASATPQTDASPALDINFAVNVTGSLLRDNAAYSVTTSVTGGVNVDLGLELDFPVGALHPKLKSDFDFDWNLTSDASNPVVVFNNVQLDLGSLVSGFGGQALKTVLDNAEPIFTLAHQFEKPLPGLKQLSDQIEGLVGDLSNINTGIPALDTVFNALSDPTLLNFLKSLSASNVLSSSQQVAVDTAVKAIEEINDLRDLVTEFTNQSGLTIDFGTYTLGSSVDLETASGSLAGLIPTLSGPSSPIANQPGVSGLQQFLADNHLSTDLLDPTNVFQLLAGNDSVTVIEYSQSFDVSGPTIFNFVNQNFAIGIVPANLQVNLTIKPVEFNIRFGFDSRGLTSGDIRQGLYVGARGLNGSQAENLLNAGVSLSVELAVGQDYEIASARVGVKGSIDADVGVWFVEQPSTSGKLHVNDFGAGCTPLAGGLSVSANVDLFYDARLKLDLAAILNAAKALLEAAIRHNPALMAAEKMLDTLLDEANNIPGVDVGKIQQLKNEIVNDPSKALKKIAEGFQDIGAKASAGFEEYANKVASGAAEARDYIAARIPDTPEDLGNAILSGGGMWLANDDGGGVGISKKSNIFNRPIVTWKFGECGTRIYGDGSTTPGIENAMSDPAILGIVIDGVLYIYVGPQAPLRNVDSSEINEQVLIRPADAADPGNGQVIVSMFGRSQVFSGVTRIIADAGDGDNVMDGAGTAIPMQFTGGSGADTFTAGLRSVTFFGGGGLNTLTGSPEADFLYGGYERDVIVGLAGNDLIYGYEGNDVLIGDYYPGTENDVSSDPALFGNDKIYAGAGDDFAYAGPGDDEIDGGLGNDALQGGAGADLIYGGGGHENIEGGDGNDIIYTGQGNSYIDAGKGNDVVNAGQGINFLIGGQGDDTMVGNILSDFFYYSEGDGTDFYEGGTGENYLLLDLYSGGSYQFSPGGTRLDITGQGTVNDIPTSFKISGANLHQVYAYVGAGGSNVRINNLADTNVEFLYVTLGASRTAATNLIVEGRQEDDDILVTAADAIVEVHGVGPLVVFQDTTPTDQLMVRGNAGNDHLEAAMGGQALVAVTLDGGSGNDFLSGAATLLGGAGDDILQGAMGYANTLNGGEGTDTLLVSGTSNADVITLRQTSATVLTVQLGIIADNETIAGLELVRVEAGSGSDIIAIEVADKLAGSLAFQVLGGGGNDRLIVNDHGFGDLVIQRLGIESGVGSITVGQLAAIEYESIERTDVTPLNSVTGTLGADNAGRLLVIPYDVLESNDDVRNATPIGGSPTFVPNLSIDPGPLDIGGSFGTVPGDEDWFEFRADKVGTFRFEILFQQIAKLANDRPGLPGNGDLDIEVYNQAGERLASKTGAGDNAFVDISVAAGSRYYARVTGANGAINVYDLRISEVDLAGPQVTAVYITGNAAFNLFAAKPALFGPTPAVKSLTIEVQDSVPRAPGDLYDALVKAAAENKGNFILRGDQSGLIAIKSVTVNNVSPSQGQLARATITLEFESALPDDRFTFTILDSITDPAGNKLDGDSGGVLPGVAAFPSGDGTAGGAFVARFTVDSRPEIGNYAGGAAFIDINGNLAFDPQGSSGDSANRDLVFQMGTLSDGLFSGKFEPTNPAANDNDGFDKLGAYGYDVVARRYRFLLDFNHDGVFDLYVPSAYQVNGIAVAGNFAPGRPGDEIGLFDGENWYFDTNGDNQLDRKVATNMRGLPLVGDFNGDGTDDLATYDAGTNTFFFATNVNFNTAVNIQWNNQLTVGGPLHGFNDRALAGDWNLDGIDDLVLWVPTRQGSPNSGLSEWYILVSDRNTPGLLPSQIFDPYSPSPLGNDVFAQFGDQFTLPIFGNFDPPVVQPTLPVAADRFAAFLSTNPNNPHDVDGDGLVTPTDAVLVINSLNVSGGASYYRSQGSDVMSVSLDVSGDGFLAPLDALLIINYLNAGGQSEPAAQREVAATPTTDASPATETNTTAAAPEVATYFHDLGDKAGQSGAATGSASQATELATIAADIAAPLPPWYFIASETAASNSSSSDSDEGDEYWDDLAEDLALAWSE